MPAFAGSLGESSNGRMAESDSASPGSSPGSPLKKEKKMTTKELIFSLFLGFFIISFIWGIAIFFVSFDKAQVALKDTQDSVCRHQMNDPFARVVDYGHLYCEDVFGTIDIEATKKLRPYIKTVK